MLAEVAERDALRAGGRSRARRWRRSRRSVRRGRHRGGAATRLTVGPNQSPSRCWASPLWSPIRTRSGPTRQCSVPSERCAATAAATPSIGRSNTAATPSPRNLKTWPPWVLTTEVRQAVVVGEVVAHRGGSRLPQPRAPLHVREQERGSCPPAATRSACHAGDLVTRPGQLPGRRAESTSRVRPSSAVSGAQPATVPPSSRPVHWSPTLRPSVLPRPKVSSRSGATVVVVVGSPSPLPSSPPPPSPADDDVAGAAARPVTLVVLVPARPRRPGRVVDVPTGPSSR